MPGSEVYAFKALRRAFKALTKYIGISQYRVYLAMLSCVVLFPPSPVIILQPVILRALFSFLLFSSCHGPIAWTNICIYWQWSTCSSVAGCWCEFERQHGNI
jgi:hypothetical protein